MKIDKADVPHYPNIGLYACATDKYCLIGREAPKQLVRKIESVLDVKPIICTIAGTSLIGIFAAADGNTILLPETAFWQEIHYLESKGLKCKVIKSRFTALGNLLAIGPSGIFASSELSAPSKKQIRQALDKTLHPGDIAGLPYTGQLITLCGSKGLVCSAVSEQELDYAQSTLGVALSPCTVNMGTYQIKSGIIANSNGIIIGDLTTPVEVQQIYDAVR